MCVFRAGAVSVRLLIQVNMIVNICGVHSGLKRGMVQAQCGSILRNIEPVISKTHLKQTAHMDILLRFVTDDRIIVLKLRKQMCDETC